MGRTLPDRQGGGLTVLLSYCLHCQFHAILAAFCSGRQCDWERADPGAPLPPHGAYRGAHDLVSPGNVPPLDDCDLLIGDRGEQGIVCHQMHLPAWPHGGGLHFRVLDTHHSPLHWIIVVGTGSAGHILPLRVHGIPDQATRKSAYEAPNHGTGSTLGDQSTRYGPSSSTNSSPSRCSWMLAHGFSELGTPHYGPGDECQTHDQYQYVSHNLSHRCFLPDIAGFYISIPAGHSLRTLSNGNVHRGPIARRLLSNIHTSLIPS